MRVHMHNLLKRQIRKFFGNEKLVPEGLLPFLGAIDEAYAQNDVDRSMLERSLDISSDEMRDAYKKLRTLHDELENRIQERTVELLEANRQLQMEIVERQQIEKMQNAVYRIAQATDEIQKLNELYPIIHDIISDVMPARNFYIALCDEKFEKLEFVYYVDEMDAVPPGEINPGRGMSAYVLRMGRSLLCDQGAYHELEGRGEIELLGPPSPIWLGVPLSLHGRTIGVMAVQHYSDPDAYNENEQRILEFVSTQVARAIERKKSEEELRSRETRYDALIRNSVDHISLIAPDGTLLFENNTIERPLGYPPNSFINHDLFALVHPDDVHKARQFLDEVLQNATVNHTWDLRLRAQNGEWRWLEGTAINLLDDPAVQAIVLNYRDATERRQTRAILDRQNRILSSLNAITPVLMGKLELVDVLQTIISQAARLMDTPDGFIYLVDPDESILRVETGIGLYKNYTGFRIRFAEGLAGLVWQTGQPQVVEDYQSWENRSKNFDAIIHAITGVPLTSGGKTVGVIGLSHGNPNRTFSEEDIELLTRFAQLASIAFENANLHRLVQLELTARIEAETNLRRLTDNMLDLITEIDAEGIIRYASPSHERVLGLDPGRMIGRSIFERLHPEEVAGALLVFSQATVDGKPPGIVTFRYQHANGHYIWVECVGNVLIDSQGQINGAVLSSRDITERKEMETALRKSEQRYRLLADNADDVIWVQDIDLRLVYVSPSIEKLLGYTVEESLSSGIMQILTPQSSRQARRLFSRSMIEADKATPDEIRSNSRTIELEVIRKDKSTIWTETRMSFLLDEHGKPNRILGVTRDITERRMAREALEKSEATLRQLNLELEERVRERTSALRESEERYILAVQGANDGIWDWNLRRKEIYFSPRWKTMLGYGEEEIENAPSEWFRRIHTNDLSLFQSAFSAHLRGETDHFEVEYRIMDKHGKYLWMLCRGLMVRDQKGLPYRLAGSQTDITGRKMVEERLEYDALHDSLTGLPNRTLFLDRLQQRLEHGKRHKKDMFAILFLDMDRFKVINDSLGHAVGDKFLITAALRLQSCLRPEDTISRLGGDEFAILLNDICDVSDAIRVAERIQSRMRGTTVLGSIQRSSSVSIGITVFNGNYTDPQEMLRDADTAMYRAKAQGGGRYQVFDMDMYRSALALLQREAELKRAVDQQEWLVYYQPVVHLASRKIAGVEALIRWNHPERGLILPGEFISNAEESGLIIQIGEYVLQEACRQVKIWRESGHPDFWVSVNLSARQFQDHTLVQKIRQILQNTGLTGAGLRLEVTETVAMMDFEYSIKILKELNDLGIHLSLDDFGNGYSSLSYLKGFPIKSLKIDRSFIRDIDVNKSSEAIASAIISLGHSLNLEVVAEGVETEKQFAFLKEQVCNEIQGFLFGRPAPGDQITELIQHQRSLWNADRVGTGDF